MKYTTTFSSTIKPLVSEERDKYLAMASLIDIGDFIPEINTNKNIDLLPIAFNACVVNRVNKNGDVIDTETALDVYSDFINKPVNIEHNRHRVVGTILTAGFSEFGTDRLLSKEDAEKLKGPFNITLGGVFWKVTDPDLADVIENSNDPTSEDYQKVSASWELGFNEYEIVVLEGDEKNIENGEIIKDSKLIAEIKDKLKSLGGTGELKEGKFVYRKVIAQVIPLGIGLTESPAADVRGVAVKSQKRGLLGNTEEGSVTNETDPKTAKTTSLFEEKNVNIEKDVVMKITSLKDINDESLKVLEATDLHDFIQEEIRKESEKFSTEKVEKEASLKETQEKLDALSQDKDKIKVELEKVSTDLQALQEEKATKEAEELFNQRMASFDEEYDLTDEDRKVIASDIHEVDEESFTAYQEKMQILLRDKNKELIAKKAEEVKEAVEPAEPAEPTEASKAQEEAKEVVDEALDNAEVEEGTVAATTQVEEPTVYDRYKEAFSLDNFNISE